jgi:hypothetical protein
VIGSVRDVIRPPIRPLECKGDEPMSIEFVLMIYLLGIVTGMVLNKQRPPQDRY